MSPSEWIHKARNELDRLAESTLDDPNDAWRALVLSARLLGCPSPSLSVPAAIPARLAPLMNCAGPSDGQALFGRVLSSLEGDDHPWGPLLDALLDIDDALSVNELVGGLPEAKELAQRTAAVASLFPERVAPLSRFAEMRLETIRESAAVTGVWRAVMRAPADLLADALAVRSSHAPRFETTYGADVVTLDTVVELPVMLLQSAASSHDGEQPIQLEVRPPGAKAWVSEEAGRMHLEILSQQPQASVVVLELKDHDTDMTLHREVLRPSKAAAIRHVDLGPWAGRENILQAALAKLGRRAESVRVVVVLERG